MISVCVHRCTLRAYCASKKMHIREKHRGAMCVKKKGNAARGHHHRRDILFSHAEFESEIELDYPTRIVEMESKDRLF